MQMPYSICRLIELHALFDSDFEKHKFTYLSTNRMPQPIPRNEISLQVRYFVLHDSIYPTIIVTSFVIIITVNGPAISWDYTVISYLKWILVPFVENDLKGKLGEPAYLEEWITTITSLTAGESAFKVTFDWDEEIGVPGAFLIRNNHHSEFYLKTVTLEDVPGQGRVHFVCNSWIYPTKRYNYDRVFFTNQVIMQP